MTEEEAVNKSTSGNIRKYADNILPMVIKFIIKKFTRILCKFYVFLGSNKENHEIGSKYYGEHQCRG